MAYLDNLDAQTILDVMFRKPRSLGIRIWHWLQGLVVLGLLGTVLLRMTLLKKSVVSPLIQSSLQDKGASVSADQATSVAELYVGRLWEWHVYLGYALTALLILRGLVFIKDRFRKSPRAAGVGKIHYRLVKTLYAAFYVSVLVMILTGLNMVFGDVLKLSDQINELLFEVHENLMWFILGFVVLHILGVLKAESSEDKGIVSEMIHGG